MGVFTKIERSVELLIWNSRRAIFLAVIACMVAFFAVLFMTVIDLFQVVIPVYKQIINLEFAADTGHLHEETLKRVVGLVDSFLVAIFLLIFAFGMYELFVSELDPARKEQRQSRGDTAILGLLSIRNLDDLKSNLVKVITAILIVTLFENAVALDVNTPIELVYFAAAIVLVASALYIIHLANNLEITRSRANSNDAGGSASPDSRQPNRAD